MESTLLRTCSDVDKDIHQSRYLRQQQSRINDVESPFEVTENCHGISERVEGAIELAARGVQIRYIHVVVRRKPIRADFRFILLCGRGATSGGLPAARSGRKWNGIICLRYFDCCLGASLPLIAFEQSLPPQCALCRISRRRHVAYQTLRTSCTSMSYRSCPRLCTPKQGDLGSKVRSTALPQVIADYVTSSKDATKRISGRPRRGNDDVDGRLKLPACPRSRNSQAQPSQS